MNSKIKAKRWLRNLSKHGAYSRYPHPARREELGQKYKKGYEIRLLVRSEEQIHTTQLALAELGFTGGKPFKKNTRWVIPIYGKDRVKRFSTLFKLPRHKIRTVL